MLPAAPEELSHFCCDPNTKFDTISRQGLMIKVLFLSANPTNTSHLALGSEYRDILGEVRKAHGNALNIIVESAVRIKDLQGALLRHQPTIVHFSGHGQGRAPNSDGREFLPLEQPASSAGILAEDDGGNAVPIPVDALADLFRIVRGIEGVVLCACHSTTQAEAIRQHVNFVIGMDQGIADASAIAFSVAFYRTLAFGKTVETAFELGVNAIKLENLPGADVPKLLARYGVDLSTSFLAGQIMTARHPTPVEAIGDEDREHPFLIRVERIVLLRHPKARITRLQAPAPFSGMLEVEIDEGFLDVGLVVALDRPITIAILAQFFADIEQPFRTRNPGLRLTLVHQGETAQETLRDEASRHRIALKTFHVYQGLFDLTKYLEWQTARLESNQVYPPNIYVDSPATYEVAGVRDHKRIDNALQFLWDLLASAEHRRFALVLGEFGAGKTFLLRELARRMHVDDHPVWPVLVEMDKLEKRHDLPALLAAHFSQADVPGYNHKAFQYMLEEGRIALLFDGFDELADRVTYDTVTAHLDTVLSAAQGGCAKVVLSSRRQHFLSESQVKLDLTRRAEKLPGFHLVLLQRFEELHIRQYLHNVLRNEHAADERYELIHEVKDLLGLSHNPRMLGFIAAIDVSKLREAKRKQGTITAAGLYELLVGQWLDFEYDRERRRSTLKGISRKALERGMIVLATSMWRKKAKTVELKDIREVLTEAMRMLSEPTMDPDVIAFLFGSGSLLVRDTEGRFSFVHRSVMEWLVALEAARELCVGDTPVALDADEMSPLMADFFHSMTGREKAVGWARSNLFEHDKGIAAKNAKLVLRRLGESLARIDLAGQDLRGRDCSGEDWRWADLRGADLTGATLVGADLSGANLTGAILTRANLTGARLVGARVGAADLRLARLIRTDLSESAGLDSANFFRTNLAGAIGPEKVIEVLVNPFGAPPRLYKTEPMWGAPSALCASVAFDAKGDLLATGFGDGTVRIFDVGTGELLRVLAGHTHGVRSVAFRFDGQTLASGSDDKTVRLWDLASGRCIRVLEGHKNWVKSVAFSPDGRTLASGSWDHTIRLWDFATGYCSRVLEGHKNCIVASVAFSPDGKRLASGDKDVRLWDVISGRCLRVLVGHSNNILSVAFGPDGNSLASGSSDKTVRLWRVDSDRCSGVLHGHKNPVWSVAISPDGKTLASGSSDNTIRIWDVSTGRGLHVIEGHTNGVWSVAYSPDGQFLASGSSDTTIRLWDVGSGGRVATLQGHKNRTSSVAFSPDGKHLASSSSGKAVRLWDVTSGRSVNVLDGHTHIVCCVVFGPDGRTVASGSYDRTIRLWDVASGSSRVLEGHRDWVTNVAFGPDGTSLVSGSSDRTVRLWDTASGRNLREFEGHTKGVLSVAVSTDGKFLASGSEDYTVRLWDVLNDNTSRELEPHTDVVWCVAFNCNGQMLASASEDTMICLWDVASGHRIRIFKGHTNGVSSVAFSPDGTFLVSGSEDSTVRFWHVNSGHCLHVLKGHTNGVRSVALSPDGKTIASSSRDGAIHLWSIAAGQCFAILYATHEGWAAFTPDGRYKFGGNLGGSFWHVVGLCRFEIGEIDEVMPDLRMNDDEPFVPPTSRSSLPSSRRVIDVH